MYREVYESVANDMILLTHPGMEPILKYIIGIDLLSS